MKTTLVLLVSSDLGTIETMARHLDYDRYALIIMKNSEDAIKSIQLNPPDVVVIDAKNNHDIEPVYHFLAQKQAKTPLVLITSRKDIPGIDFEADEVIYKPVNPVEMSARIEAVTRIKELEQQLTGSPFLSSFTKPKVLIVEDSPVQRHILKRYLSKQDFEIYTAADGQEAIEVATHILPDIILLDMMLPKMNGLEVCRRLKVYHPTAGIPLVFITSHDNIHDKIQALESGAQDFLIKPVNQQELLIRIRSLLRHKQLVEALAIQASRDPLTEVFNRRQFMVDLPLELKRAKRYNSPLSLIMVDVDHFKNYNDIHGHVAGDEILRELARLLTSNLRSFDKVSRYGGEEFVIILPQTNLEGAVNVASKLCRLVEEHPFPNQETQPGGTLTISLGVAVFPNHADNPDELLLLADQALYQAKKNGRNRYVVAPLPANSATG